MQLFFSCEGGWAPKGRASSRLRTSDRSRHLEEEVAAAAGEAGQGGGDGCDGRESTGSGGPEDHRN